MHRNLFFDIEANGLLDLGPLLKGHCLGAIDLDTGEELYYGPPVPKGHPKWDPIVGNPAGTLEDGVRLLQESEMSIAHNGCGYDFIALQMMFPWFKLPPKAWDSLVMAKVVWPYDTLIGPDMDRARKGLMPMQMVKRHSLEAWGWRLGEHKDEYDGDKDKYPEPRDRKAKAGDERWERRWEEWNAYMASYMLQDNRPGVRLWNLIKERLGWGEKLTAVTWPESVIQTECRVAYILALQERDGVWFDRAKAQKLSAELSNEQARLGAILTEAFGSWWAGGKVQTPTVSRNVKRQDLPYVTRPRVSPKTGKALADYHGPVTEGYTEGCPYTPIVWTKFNPSSRDHLGQRLQAVFGWVPKKFGSNGKPTVDETVLEEIPEAVIPKALRSAIMDYFVVSKTLGTLANGSKAWLNLAGADDKMHGRMDSAGAITGRGTHKDPNLSGTPAVLKEKVVGEDGVKKEVIVRGLKGRYGWECRELFGADPGWEQTGVDASSLELILLGHYMHPHDEGLFSARVCDPTRDAHQENADIADMTRADAKTAIYLFVYGGGAYKLSLSLSVDTPEEELEYLTYKGLPMLLKNLVKRFDQTFVDKLDDNQKARIAKARVIIVKFEKNIEGLRALIDLVTEVAARGWLKGLDGRKVIVRKAYSALNTLLQSAGAQSVKLWMVLLHDRLQAEGLVWGRDYRQTLFVHDELQFTHRPSLGPQIAAAAQDTLKEAGRILGLRGEFRGEAKHGLTCADCH